MRIFKKNKVNCFFCKIEINKNKMFIIEYKFAEGVEKVKVCETCAEELDKIIAIRNMKLDD
jgi:hypothetical protein